MNDLFRFGCLLHQFQCHRDGPITTGNAFILRTHKMHVIVVCMCCLSPSDRHLPQGNRNKSATWIFVQGHSVIKAGIRRAPAKTRRSQSQRRSSRGVERRASRDKRRRRADLQVFMYRGGSRQTVSQNTSVSRECQGCDSAPTQQFRRRDERGYAPVQQRQGSHPSGILNIT